MSLVKFVVGYCGTVAIHTHVNAAEWNTVIEGEGEVAYWGVNNGLVKMQVKKGDTFVFPQGAAHYWVNYSPNTQLVTVGGFTARSQTRRCLSHSCRRQSQRRLSLRRRFSGKITRLQQNTTRTVVPTRSFHYSHTATPAIAVVRRRATNANENDTWSCAR